MLELKKITKTYEVAGFKTKALNKIDIKFRENEFVSILGQSGSGKTTLLNIVGGLDGYTSGDLIINGTSTKEFTDRDWDTYRNHRVGFVFQSYNLIPHQTALQNVELALTLSGIGKEERRKRAINVLKKVGLEKQMNKRPNQMSGGQMQRIAIARALINDPDILLADEPTGALDSETSLQVLDLLKEIAKDKLVIMVTHNPELALNYSTRIVKLLDGEIVDDTNPFDGNDEVYETAEKAKKKSKKTSMNFKTAFGLSLNNLMTKKGRTILTAFAGSIGIIGIALIMSLSNGIQEYIDRVQEETLASYPIQLTDEVVDTSSMLMTIMSENSSNEERSLNKIYTNNVLTELINNLNKSVEKNNLKKFKEYIEDNREKFDEYSSTISYGYGVTPYIYRIDEEDKVVQANPSVVMDEIGMGDMMNMADNLSFVSGSSSQTNVFTEIIDNEELNKSSYDVIAGIWPTKYNEVILFVNSNNEISDFTLYALGLADQSKIKDNMNNILMGEEVIPIDNVYTYDEILDLEFKLVLNSDMYKKNKTTGMWEDKSSDKKFMDKLARNGETIKVVGIARPNEESVNQNNTGYIGYLPELITHVIEENSKSELAKEQKTNKDTNIFTGLDFGSEQKFDMSSLTPEQQQYIATLSPEELTALIEQYSDNETATYESNIKKIGAPEFDSPSDINIYPVDFESKEAIQDLIIEYNQNAEEEDKINYTDVVGIMMKGVVNIVNTISYVLIAFVAISLIVSSIMIGIITYISVLERTKEIGILRAIGASKKDISRVFNAETLIEGSIAGLIGIGTTLLLNIPINIIIKSITDISNIAILPVDGAIILIIISILLTVIAGFIPAKIASKKDPVEALRTE